MADWRDPDIGKLGNISDSIHSMVRQYTPAIEDIQRLTGNLDQKAQALVSGSGPDQWTGLASDAFISAWGKRKQLLQDSTDNAGGGLGILGSLAKTIDDNIPAIKTAQSLDAAQQQNPMGVRHHLPDEDQQQVFSNAQDATNNITLAFSLLSTQLDSLPNDFIDCEQLDSFPNNTIPPVYDNPYINQMSKSKGIPPMPGGLPPYVNQTIWENLIDDTNPKFQLSPDNAALALSDAPAGTESVDIAGEGGQAKDITFKDANGNIIGKRELKDIQGTKGGPRPFGTGTFSDEISKGAKQVGYNGNVFVQVPDGTDYQYYLQNFVGARKNNPADLAKYENVTITMVDQSGNVLYDGALAP